MKSQSMKSVRRASAPATEFADRPGRAPAHPLQRLVDSSKRQNAQSERLAQLQRAPATDNPNGLPHHLRAGIESLSGMDMSDVVVHRNSAKPAQLNAMAYAQGNEIHLGPGQERHLSHEAWHVVQQAQGRVKSANQMKVGVSVNDDESLEHEADVMGGRASSEGRFTLSQRVLTRSAGSPAVVQGRFWEKRPDGTYLWHDEAPGDRYARLDEKRNYYNWYNPLNAVYGAYGVYTHGAVDRSGSLVESGLAPQENLALQNIQNTIGGTAYGAILDCLERRILERLGQSTLDQFYKGAHIIFQDNGQVYNQIFNLGRGVAKFRPQTLGEWLRGQRVEEIPSNLLPSTTGGAGMGARRPERKETSHYTQDDLPQIGIDLPGALSGHILVGRVPTDQLRYGRSAGHTFVQTEMFGFKTFYDHYIGHGKGFFWNFVASHQSGLVGYCKYSEKSGTEIREQDNPHVAQ